MSEPRNIILQLLLLDAWQQFSYRVPSNDAWSHDGGLSTLEAIRETLEGIGWLRPVSERPETDWRELTPAARAALDGDEGKP